jgi:predicted nucleic acid-binding protein
MALIVLDASVVIAFLDGGDGHHGAAISVLEETAADERILPASAYAEVLVAPMRRDPRDAEKVDQALAAVAIRVEPLTREVARAAAVLRARHRTLRLPDALVLATAEVLGALVVTADRDWKKIRRQTRTI